MKLFNTVALEISSRCNRRCQFCPVAYKTRPDELMPKNLIRKVLIELGSIKYAGRIELYIYNEPMRNRLWLMECLSLVRKIVPRSCLMIATNGDYIRGCKDVTDLFDNGLNQLLVNCYSSGLLKKRMLWVNALPSEITETDRVYGKISSGAKAVQILDKSNLALFGRGAFKLMNRAGNVPKFLPGVESSLQRMCVKPFRLLNINWQGNALVCCQDYHGVVAYGNVAHNSLVELWNHPVINEYRRRLLRRDRSLPLCRQCDCSAGVYSHNVDIPSGPFLSREEIERLFRQNRQKQSPLK